MGCLYSRDLIRVALAEVGYQAEGKWNKYAYDLDQVDFFTGCGKKQGLDWCSVFTSWCAYMSVRNSDGEFDPDVWDAHYFLYQPDSNDCAAVVSYVVQYYKEHGAWFTNPQDLCVGDQLVFQNSKGYSHTGWCYDWDDYGCYSVEGNTNGGMVDTHYYKFSEFGNYIAGFGRPRYDGKEYGENSETPVKEEPAPAPSVEPSVMQPNKTETGTVSVNDFLSVRTGASVNCKKIGELNDGAEVIIFERDGNWARIGVNMWVCSDYLE